MANKPAGAHHSKQDYLDLVELNEKKLKNAYFDFKITRTDPDLRDVFSPKFIYQIENSRKIANLNQMKETIEKIHKVEKVAKAVVDAQESLSLWERTLTSIADKTPNVNSLRRRLVDLKVEIKAQEIRRRSKSEPPNTRREKNRNFSGESGSNSHSDVSASQATMFSILSQPEERNRSMDRGGTDVVSQTEYSQRSIALQKHGAHIQVGKENALSQNSLMSLTLSSQDEAEESAPKKPKF